ncbi:MAG: hypothetical protein JW893_05525 [Candidatus Omnitrophica bacterium]|nr:hypothetical protein [Candidatus Omnitrophota bacterium]
MKKITRFKQCWLLMAVVCLIGLGAGSIAGCAGRTQTSTVTTQTTDGSGSESSRSVTTQTETSAHPRGVIGGIFYTIGQILLFPFRVIGSLF